jgi:thioesterase domain-containing protein
LRVSVAKRVPDYMIPSHFVILSAFPLNSNGKLDRKAFPVPQSLTLLDFSDNLPITELEQYIARLWSQLLHIDLLSISREDNFFFIGGDSVLSLRFLNLMLSVFPRLNLIDVVSHSVLKDLAAFLSCNSFGLPIIQLCKNPCSILPPIFLVHPIAGLSFCYLPFSTYANRTMYGLNDPFFGKPGKFESIVELASFYVKVIRQIHPCGPYCLGGWSLGGVIALEMATQMKLMNYSVDTVVLIDSFCEEQAKHENEIYSPAVSPRFDVNFVDSVKQQHIYSQQLLFSHRYSYFDGPVVLIKALGDNNQPDPLNGWRDYLPNLIVQTVHGKHDHLFTHEPEIVMKKVLDAFDSSFSPPEYVNNIQLDVAVKNLLYSIEQQDMALLSLLLEAYQFDINKVVVGTLSILQFARQFGTEETVELILI